MGQVLRAVSPSSQGATGHQLRGVIGSWSQSPVPQGQGSGHGVIVCGRVPVSIVKMISTPLLLQLQQSLRLLMRLYSAGQGLKVLWWAWREGGRNGFLYGLGSIAARS